MRVAVVSPPPAASTVDKCAWVVAGFEAAGHEAWRCHTLAEIHQADHEADLVLLDHKAAGVNHNSLADMSRRRRAIWVQWYRDLVAFDARLPLAQQPYINAFRRLMSSVDCVLVKERGMLADYQRLGINAVWCDQACPADIPRCEPREPKWDVIVLGSTTYPQRRQDARQLIEAGYRVLWIGPHGADPVPGGCEWRPFVHPFQLAPILSEAAVVLGVDWRHDIEGFTSDRAYLVAGMGACYVARVGGTDSPQAAVASWTYSDAAALAQVIQEALASTADRRLRAEQARDLVMAEHTYRERAEQIVALVSSESFTGATGVVSPPSAGLNSRSAVF